MSYAPYDASSGASGEMTSIRFCAAALVATRSAIAISSPRRTMNPPKRGVLSRGRRPEQKRKRRDEERHDGGDDERRKRPPVPRHLVQVDLLRIVGKIPDRHALTDGVAVGRIGRTRRGESPRV